MENSRLTKRETEILKLLADGLSNKEAAYKLNLSVRTIDAHRLNISRRLNIRTFAGLIKYAIRIGLVSVEE